MSLRTTITEPWRGCSALAALVARAFPCQADETLAPSDATAGHPVSERARQDAGEIDGPMVPRAAPEALPSVPLRWSSSAELAGNAYRLSLSRGALDLGLSLDTPARASHPSDVRTDLQGPVMATLPSVSVGLRRGTGSDASASLLGRALGQGRDDSLSKVGIQWKPAESNVSFLRDGLGIRLEGNERITMKLRKGMVGVYMHHRF